MPDTDRPKPYRTEEEAQRPGPRDGAQPRSPTEPPGSEGSSTTSKTRTDPSTGEPTGGRPDTAG